MILSNDTIICRKNDQVMTSELGNELVMMHMENGIYISLNSVGRVIWEMAGEPVSISVITKQLVAKYQVEEEKCLCDILEYVQKMKDQDILEIV